MADTVGRRTARVAPRVLAMARRTWGEFDIHGGGLDLIFPHHENEIAQSKAAGTASRRTGRTTGGSPWGEKMSKSLGNLLVSEVVQRVRPIELRYYLWGRTTVRSRVL